MQQHMARPSREACSGAVDSEAPGTIAGAIYPAMRSRTIVRTLVALCAVSYANSECGFRIAARLHGTAHMLHMISAPWHLCF